MTIFNPQKVSIVGLSTQMVSSLLLTACSLVSRLTAVKVDIINSRNKKRFLSETLFIILKFTYFSLGFNSATYWILFADTWDAPIGCVDFNQAIVDNKLLGLRNSKTFAYKN